MIRICEFYQKGRRFRRPAEIQLIVRGLIHHSAPEIERWALKVLVEFSDGGDFDLVHSRLKDPPSNYENFTWAVSAFFSVANDNQINEAIEKKLIPKDGMSMLACNYAGRAKFGRGKFPSIDIQKADSLTLKWSALTVGIGRAGAGVFDPRFNQTDQLVALNRHDDRDVVQYSIYAMYRLPRLRFENSGIPVHEVFSRPENVRRWIYRLLCKQPQSVVTNRDFLVEAIRSERDLAAREGLALGLRYVWFDGLPEVMCDWLSKESDYKCRVAILEHMASNSDRSMPYKITVIDHFVEAYSDRVLRSRIMDAAARTSVYAELNRKRLVEEAQVDLFGNQSSGGLIVMGNNNQIFKDSSNIQIGANALGGNATASNIEQVMKIDQSLLQLLDQIQKLATADRDNGEAKLVLEALDQMKAKPEIGKVKVLLERIKTWTAVGALSAEALSNLQPIVEVLHKAIGGA